MNRKYKAKGRCAACQARLIVTTDNAHDAREIQAQLDAGRYFCAQCESKRERGQR